MEKQRKGWEVKGRQDYGVFSVQTLMQKAEVRVLQRRFSRPSAVSAVSLSGKLSFTKAANISFLSGERRL